jgi:hypothetical protein
MKPSVSQRTERGNASRRTRRPGIIDSWQFGEKNLLWAILILFVLGITSAAIALLLLSGKPSSLTRVVAGLVGALAGAVIGATMTILIDKRVQQGPLSQMLQLLERTIDSTMTSPERDLAGLRTVWHHYHLTLIDGHPTWRYSIFRFDEDLSIGSLTSRIINDDPEGEPHEYRVDAAVRGSRLIVTQTPLRGQEAPAVEIFPHILQDFRRIHAGLGVMQTWDGDEIFGPVLLSHASLCDEPTAGSMSRADARHLTTLWEKTFAPLGELLRDKDSREAKRLWQVLRRR